MKDYQKIFIRNLKTLRKEKNLTQSQLAELCDISNGTIGNIECGMTKPSFDLMVRFAEMLKVSPSKFFHVEEPAATEQRELMLRLKSGLVDFIEREFSPYT